MQWFTVMFNEWKYIHLSPILRHQPVPSSNILINRNTLFPLSGINWSLPPYINVKTENTVFPLSYINRSLPPYTNEYTHDIYASTTCTFIYIHNTNTQCTSINNMNNSYSAYTPAGSQIDHSFIIYIYNIHICTHTSTYKV